MIPRPTAFVKLPRLIPGRRKKDEQYGVCGVGAARLEANLMSLERGAIKGYEFDRMVFLFSMTDGGKEVSCAISTSAMDDLEHAARTAPGQREEQFLRLRDRIEKCASRKFLANELEGSPPGIVLRSIDFRS